MKWLSVLGMGLSCLGAVACGPVETGPSCPDPADGEVDEECGIWVSASLGDDANPGTRAAPMASLSAAVAKATNENVHLYACGELWTEPLILPATTWLYGGFDCHDGWTFKGETHRARIETGPDQIPLRTAGYGKVLQITDFSIRAADATVPGGSSIAVFVDDQNDVTFRRCGITAGRGADGLDAEAIVEPAPAGAEGSAGADACTTADGPGGTSPETACGTDVLSRGGKGGDGGAMLATAGEAGLPAPRGEKDPSDPQDGDGGKGQIGAEPCTPGEPGADGAKGARGTSSLHVGFLTVDGYRGHAGEDGKDGLPGQGGGGGGAARGGAAVCGAATPGGAGGGSGGAGGCGGQGGKGGQPGGSSFAIVMLRNSTYFLAGCDVWVSDGGNGGDGAPGQPGGAGGEPGPGGAGQGTLQNACQGGKGGAGGKGGGGAGGQGGHAIHFAFDYVTIHPKDFSQDTTYHSGAFGGEGGNGAEGAESGDGGYDSAIGGTIYLQFLE